jgi:uroporphyrinogen-III synthase
MKKPYALITRPTADAQTTAANLKSMGIDSFIEPLLEIVYLPDNAQHLHNALKNAQGIIVTSSNAVRAIHSFSVPKNFPLIAVGKVTASRAKDLGFTDVKNSHGDVHNLADFIIKNYSSDKGHLIYASATITAGNIVQELADSGFAVDAINVYRSIPAEKFSQKCLGELPSFDMVLLYSSRTAKVFANLLRNYNIRELGFDKNLHTFCLSDKVAKYMEEFGFTIHVAERPDNESLMELIRNFKFTE